MQNDIEDIKYLLDELLDDGTIPRNVKAVLNDIKVIIQRSSSDAVKLSDSVYKLQDISEDVNLPLNAKSDIWMLQSKVEKLKESVK